MQTIKEIQTALKDAENRLPDVVRSVAAAIRDTQKRVDERGKLDAALDADLVRLSAAAAERDSEKIEQILAGIAVKRTKRAKLDQEIEAATTEPKALLNPLSPAINSAIAIGAILPVLLDHWHELDADVRSKMMKASERLVRW
jgi:Sec-independent protein translocase protein TatA